jgi:hypothetical protein
MFGVQSQYNLDSYFRSLQRLTATLTARNCTALNHATNCPSPVGIGRFAHPYEVLNQFAVAQQMLSPNDTSFRTHVTAQTVEFERGEMDQAFLMSGALSDSAYGSATGLEGPLHILTAARSPRDPTGWWRRC